MDNGAVVAMDNGVVVVDGRETGGFRVSQGSDELDHNRYRLCKKHVRFINHLHTEVGTKSPGLR